MRILARLPIMRGVIKEPAGMIELPAKLRHQSIVYGEEERRTGQMRRYDLQRQHSQATGNLQPQWTLGMAQRVVQSVQRYDAKVSKKLGMQTPNGTHAPTAVIAMTIRISVRAVGLRKPSNSGSSQVFSFERMLRLGYNIFFAQCSCIFVTLMIQYLGDVR